MLLVTKTEVFNMASGMLGQTLLTQNADQDMNTVFRTMRMHWRNALNKTLAAHPWSSYTKRQALALIDANPTQDWGFAYANPEDCNTIQAISSENFFTNNPYAPKVGFSQGRAGNSVVIYTNMPKAWAKYTATPDENEAFVSQVADALAAQLTLLCAPAIITNNYLKIKAQLNIDMKNIISNAIAEDIQKQPDDSKDYSPVVHTRIRYDY